MGFDVYGRKPSGKEGEYFRRNNWGWSQLADYIRSVAPNIAAKCTYWYSNNGDGLTAKQAAALADRIDDEIRNGRFNLYSRARGAVSETEPIDVETVKELVAFLRASGGFKIC